jgi:hypothetical protein
MYLDAAKANGVCDADPSAAAVHARWAHFPISQIGHHGTDCCECARAWLRNMDFAQLNGSDRATGPRWLRKQYEWGPSAWPLHWCEALDADAVDCGAHAAFAHEVLEARGTTAFRAQFVQCYDARAIAQWRTRWGAKEASDHWLGDGFIYHEGNAVLVGQDEVKLWDGSAGCWLNPTQTSGYGSLLAVRIATQGSPESTALRWGSHRVAPNIWQALTA